MILESDYEHLKVAARNRNRIMEMKYKVLELPLSKIQNYNPQSETEFVVKHNLYTSQ